MGIHIWQLNMCKNSFSAGVYERWQFSTIVPLEWVTNHQLQWKKTLRQSSNANLIQWWTLGSRTLFSLPYMRTISCFILGNPVQHASLKASNMQLCNSEGRKENKEWTIYFPCKCYSTNLESYTILLPTILIHPAYLSAYVQTLSTLHEHIYIFPSILHLS